MMRVAILLHRLVCNRDGSSLVQFGFIAPVLMLVTLGLIDMGRVGFAATSIRYAVSEAARFASTHGATSQNPATESQIEDFAKDRATELLEDDLSVSVSWAPDNNSGSRVTVQATMPVSLFVAAFMPISDIQIVRSSTLVIY